MTLTFRPWLIAIFFRKLRQFFMKIPFDNERIAFFSPYSSGNAKPVYDKIAKSSHFKKPYWVLLSQKETEKIKKNGIEAYYYADYKALKIFLSTPIWVLTHVDENIPIRRHKRFIDFVKDGFLSVFNIEASPTTDNFRFKEVQLWHGLGFKAWREERKREYLIHSDVYCFTSDFFKNVWCNQFKIDPDRIKLTGYPRHDILINRDFNVDEIKKEINVRLDSKIILFAPTWEQREDDKSIYYWSYEKIKEINDFCEKNNAYFIIRTHHMLKTDYQRYDLSRLLYRSVDEYSNTMRLLAVTDILITDWSSIPNDFIHLNRPTIFIDTPNPFDDDFELLPDDRVGYILNDANDIIDIMEDALDNPNSFVDSYKQVKERVMKKIFKNPDGKSTERVVEEILKLRDSNIS